jgi:uncharacterized repeat protein (TIGR03803 family)
VAVFDASAGSAAIGSPVVLGDGTVYGTALAGGPGTWECGTTFRFHPGTSDVKLVYAFTGMEDGAYPAADLVQGPDGSLYGATHEPTAFNRGVVVRSTP